MKRWILLAGLALAQNAVGVEFFVRNRPYRPVSKSEQGWTAELTQLANALQLPLRTEQAVVSG